MTTDDELRDYAEMTDDELRLAVAKACGWTEIRKNDGTEWRTLPESDFADYLPDLLGVNPDDDGWRRNDAVPNYARDTAVALALLDGMKDKDGIAVEYCVGKEAYDHLAGLPPLEKQRYYAMIFCRHPLSGDDVEATADTLARAACEAWMQWMEAQNDAHS